MAALSESSPALLFEADSLNVVIHPLVMFHVLDHHTRRQEETGRVIGTLLGRRDGRTVEITNCFAVPHAERGDEVAIGKDFNKQMLGLHLRSNRKEQVVGWYASAAQGEDDAPPLIGDTSSLIHEFYATESEEGDPVHLVVDTRLQQDRISIKAYRSTQVVMAGEAMGSLFHEVSVSLKSNEPETICLNQMILQETGEDQQKDGDQLDRLQVSMSKLHDLLSKALQYIDSVVEGKVQPDAELGRRIADAVATVPRTRPEVFERLFQDSLQDLLMVSYLSNITRTQLTVAEKLNASLGVSNTANSSH